MRAAVCVNKTTHPPPLHCLFALSFVTIEALEMNSIYSDELNQLQQELIKHQPDDIVQFCANYFNRRLADKNRGGSSSRGESFGLFNTHSFTGGDPTSTGFRNHLHDKEPASGPLAPNAAAPTSTISPPAFGSKAAESAAGGFGGWDSNFTSSSESPHDSVSALPSARAIPANFHQGRRTSVSAESLNPGAFSGASEINRSASTIHKLTPDHISRLNKSVTQNFLFQRLDGDSLHSLLYALTEKKFDKGSTIIKQGDEGDFFYIVDSGEVEFFQDDKKVNTGGAGSSFGELALMYNSPRAATVVTTQDTVVWALDRITFKKILLDKTASKRSMYEGFLKEVPLLKVLSNYERSKIADALSTEQFSAGQVVVREGDIGETFYLIEAGKAIVTKASEGKVQELGKGDYFGEVALLNESPRQATVTAQTDLKVATLDKAGFQRLLGRAVDILRRQDPTTHEIK